MIDLIVLFTESLKSVIDTVRSYLPGNLLKQLSVALAGLGGV